MLNAYSECLLCENSIDPKTAESGGVKIFLAMWAVFAIALALLAVGAL